MVLTTNDQILQWLDDHDGFANANLSYRFDPFSKELILEIGRRKKISLAGETAHFELFSVIISGVEILSGELESAERLSLFKMHSLNDTSGLIFDAWGKDEISLRCSKIYVEEAREIEEITEPIISANTLVFKIKINERPVASYWIKRLEDTGHDAMYVSYFGDEILTQEIDDYVGLSIIPKSPNRQSLGVKFCKVVLIDGILEIMIELQNSQLQNFWQDFIRILSEMEVIEVRSGNVIFARNEWINFLDSGILPKRLL